MVWNMMTPEEQQPYLPREETTAERLGGIIGAILAIGFLFFLFASYAGVCEKMLFR
jgi:hypothetical protein